MDAKQNAGAQTNGFAENLRQAAPLNCENPLTSAQRQDNLRQAKENGQMHQPY